MSEEKEKNNPVEDIPELEGLMLKKKKKKKKPLNLDDLEKALHETTGEPSLKTNEDAEADGDDENNPDNVENNENDAVDDDLDFDFSKKKKKKKKALRTFGEENDRPLEVNNDGADDTTFGGNDDDSKLENANCLDHDREYTYDELIEHVFSIIRANNPELNAGEKKRFVLKPPTVLRVGTKKTSFANFLEICKLVHRQPKHMQLFLLAELGTSGSVDANNQLIIKGRFQQIQIENVLRRYIKEYVACQTCRSPNTILQKETRLFFLQCEKCGSRRSVSSIKSGFQAVTSKRAAIRAKTN